MCLFYARKVSLFPLHGRPLSQIMCFYAQNFSEPHQRSGFDILFFIFSLLSSFFFLSLVRSLLTLLYFLDKAFLIEAHSTHSQSVKRWERKQIFVLCDVHFDANSIVWVRNSCKVLTARSLTLFLFLMFISARFIQCEMWFYFIYISFSAFAEYNMQASDRDVSRCLGERLGGSLGVCLSWRSQRWPLTVAVPLASGTMLEHPRVGSTDRHPQGW